MKRVLFLILTVAVLLSLGVPALAADTGFSDVPAGAWYAEGVQYALEQGIMTGVGNSRFDPEGTVTRAMVWTVLARLAGANTTAPAGQSWYHPARAWAMENNVSDGENPDGIITREQLATMLYRYHGSPAVTAAENFADQGDIASWAVDGVAWAKANGVVNGVGGNRFDPKGNANRAQMATIVKNYRTTVGATQPDPQPSETPEPSPSARPSGGSGGNSGSRPSGGGSTTPTPTPEPSPTPDPEPSGSKILVAYFSATGSTERVAGYIADHLSADTFEMEPVNPYTSADLNYNNSSSRVSRERNDPSLQDIALVKTTPDNWDRYDVVFVGYPIWWHAAAWPVNHFVTDNDFSGKTVIPFCTSASSPLEGSDEKLAAMTDTGDWRPGQRFSSDASQYTVEAWVEGLDLPKAQPDPAPEAEGKTLIAYFSMPDNVDDSTVTINGEVLGNNQYFAQVIQEVTGGDVFRIEAATPYPTDHATLVTQAQQEQRENARPAIKDTIDNLDYYDTVFIGYPIWWSDMPQIMYTFFDQYDFSGKTVIPFNTHGGSGFAGTPAKIKTLEPDATHLDGLSISRNVIENAHDQIVEWVKGLEI